MTHLIHFLRNYIFKQYYESRPTQHELSLPNFQGNKGQFEGQKGQTEGQNRYFWCCELSPVDIALYLEQIAINVKYVFLVSFGHCLSPKKSLVAVLWYNPLFWPPKGANSHLNIKSPILEPNSIEYKFSQIVYA